LLYCAAVSQGRAAASSRAGQGPTRAAGVAKLHEPLALRPRERVVEAAGEPAEDLVDVALRDDVGRADGHRVADRAHDQAMVLAERHAASADRELRVERGLRLLVAHELDAAQETDAARVADERVRAERAQPLLKPRAHGFDVLVQLALLVDLERAQRDGRGDRVARVREAVAE